MVAHDAWEALAEAAPSSPEKVQESARLFNDGDAVMAGSAGEAMAPEAKEATAKEPRSLYILTGKNWTSNEKTADS